jgi:DNA-directed RNA polymerase specialized sigma24 family protein
MAPDPDHKLKQHLAAAMIAAAGHDPGRYFLELVESGVLERLTRGMEAEWPHAEPGLIEAVVSDATDAVYDAVANRGKQVNEPGGYLWGTTRNIMRTRHDVGLVGVLEYDPGNHDHGRPDDDDDGPDRELLRAEALRHARALLPRLGQENVIKVMTYVFDCVAKGDIFVSNPDIAAALDLKLTAVKRAKWRGFMRLRREALKEGIELPDLSESIENESDDVLAEDEE